MQAFCRCISLAHFWHLSEVNVQVDCRKGFFLVSHPSLDYLQNAQTSGPAFFCYPENISFNVILRGKTLLRHPEGQSLITSSWRQRRKDPVKSCIARQEMTGSFPYGSGWQRCDAKNLLGPSSLRSSGRRRSEEMTGPCSFEPNSTKALKCQVSYITSFRVTRMWNIQKSDNYSK